MTGPYDPPTVPEMAHPLINEAFGWDTSSEVPPSVRQGVSQAADTLANIRSALNQNVTNVWANAAVQTDLLQGKVGYSIAGSLAQAANTVASLQHPVSMQVLGPLSTAVEMSAPLGIVPPMPGTPQNTPGCVSIKQGGDAGDIGPALEAYRVMAWPQRFARGIQYVNTVAEISNCLGRGTPAQEAFANAVLQLETLPDNAPFAVPGGTSVNVNQYLPPGGIVINPNEGLGVVGSGSGLGGVPTYTAGPVLPTLPGSGPPPAAPIPPVTAPARPGPVAQPPGINPVLGALTTWESLLAAYRAGTLPRAG